MQSSLVLEDGHRAIYSVSVALAFVLLSNIYLAVVAGFEGIKAAIGPMTRSVEDLELVARAVFDSPIKSDVAEASIAPVPYRPITLPKKLKFGYYADSRWELEL